MDAIKNLLCTVPPSYMRKLGRHDPSMGMRLRSLTARARATRTTIEDSREEISAGFIDEDGGDPWS